MTALRPSWGIRAGGGGGGGVGGGGWGGWVCEGGRGYGGLLWQDADGQGRAGLLPPFSEASREPGSRGQRPRGR